MYKFKFTGEKFAIMLVIAYLTWQNVGRITLWLIENDFYTILCFAMTLWGICYAPVWFFDWVFYRIGQWLDNIGNDKTGQYVKFKETKRK